jgi:DNA polymerase III epsilon subunit-like protein
MRFISIDIETGGIDKDKFSLLQVGAVIATANTPWETWPTCLLNVSNEIISLSPYCLDLHKELLYKPREYNTSFRKMQCVVTPESVFPKLLSWINEVYEKEFGEPVPERHNVCGKNFLAFDYPWLKELPHAEGFKFRRRILDPGPMFATISDDEVPDLKTCKERAGINGEVTHDALSDALDTARCVDEGLKNNLWMETK